MPTRPARRSPAKRKPPVRTKAAPTPAPPKKESRKVREADRLRGALTGLRATLAEIQEHYSVRTNGLLVQMMQIVDPPAGEERPALPSRKTIDRMLEEIEALKVKPNKGRGKDLQRIQALVEALWIMFPPQP